MSAIHTAAQAIMTGQGECNSCPVCWAQWWHVGNDALAFERKPCSFVYSTWLKVVHDVGVTAEMLVKCHGVSREAQERIRVRSHRPAYEAMAFQRRFQ